MPLVHYADDGASPFGHQVEDGDDEKQPEVSANVFADSDTYAYELVGQFAFLPHLASIVLVREC